MVYELYKKLKRKKIDRHLGYDMTRREKVDISNREMITYQCPRFFSRRSFLVKHKKKELARA